ncbi:hypothetical protein PLCT2_02086 [Planctomycetaceae bacterium]|nr:hypothetical protein PLCT2_02086 [Planctomycetaceae bacterium]
MKWVVILTVALLAFVAGIAVGYQFTSAAKPDRVRDFCSCVAESANAPASNRPGPHRTEESVRNEPVSSRADTPASQPPALTLADLLARLQVELPAKGSGTISGTVKTPAGAAVAGVQISAKGIGEFNAQKPGASEATLEDEVLTLARCRRYAELTRVDTTTDADGKFTVSGLSEIPYRVQAKLEGYQLREPSDAYRAKPGANLEFVASAVVRLEFDVLNPDGTQAKAARVHYEMDRGGSSLQGGALRDAGWFHYDLEPGRYTIHAEDADDSTIRSEASIVEIKVGEKPEKVVLRLIEKPCIKGKVTFEDPEAGNGANIYCVAYEGTAPDPKSIGSGDPRARRYVEDRNSIPTRSVEVRSGDGRYVVANLKPGTYLVVIRAHGELISSASVVLGSTPVVQDFNVPAPNPSLFVTLWVYSPENQLIQDVYLMLRYEDNGSMSGTSAQPSRRTDGSLRFLKQTAPEQASKDARYFVEVSSKVYGSLKLEYQREGKSELVARYETPATLTVTLNLPKDSALVSGLVISVSNGASRGFESENNPDANDPRIWKFEALVPGEYKVSLLLKGDDRFTRNQNTLSSRVITLISGANSLSLDVPSLFTLKVHVDEANGKDCSLRSTGAERSFGLSKRADENGDVYFTNILAGQYIISCSKTREKMLVSVPETSEVVFTPQVFNSYRVSVSDEKGYVSLLGLRTGDLITAANGTEFKTSNQMEGTLQALMEEKSVKLTIQRGGATLTVEADLMKLFSDRGAKLEQYPR